MSLPVDMNDSGTKGRYDPAPIEVVCFLNDTAQKIPIPVIAEDAMVFMRICSDPLYIGQLPKANALISFYN